MGRRMVLSGQEATISWKVDIADSAQTYLQLASQSRDVLRSRVVETLHSRMLRTDGMRAQLREECIMCMSLLWYP